MDYEDYERVVSHLASAIVSRAEGTRPDVRYGRDNRVRGISGFEHQIDVTARMPQSLLLIECKCWKEKIPVGHLLTFLGRVIDIKAAEDDIDVIAALVSTIGYDPGAKVIADYYHIGLETVKSPEEFSIRYKKYLMVGLVERHELKDKAVANVVKAKGPRGK
jgi:hypothetical protein